MKKNEAVTFSVHKNLSRSSAYHAIALDKFSGIQRVKAQKAISVLRLDNQQRILYPNIFMGYNSSIMYIKRN